MKKMTAKVTSKALLRSPWLEVIVMCAVVLLSFLALMLITKGAETPPGGLSLSNISLLVFGFFLLSFAIAIIAVMAGIGGGVLFTPIMLAFTPVNSLIVRATGLIVAMFSGLISSLVASRWSGPRSTARTVSPAGWAYHGRTTRSRRERSWTTV